jgi:hypothetical protein
MDQQRFRLGGQGVLMLAIAAAFPIGADGAPAARVDFAIGNATAQGQNGKVRPLTKGTEVGQGDTINTADGRVQLRFVDGAFVSLQPQSQFRIDDFRYNGQQDGTEKGFFSLLKGGLRTITGLVGRNNKSAYQVTTTVATIGIRGTEYTIVYGKSVSGSVGEGEINVCNAGGCLNVTNGESYYVQNPDIRPVLSDKKVDLPAPEPQPVPSGFAAGDNRDAVGDPVSFFLTGTQTVDAAYVKGSYPSYLANTQVVLDANGALRQANLGGGIVTWSGPVYEQGNDGIVAWGRWNGGVTSDSAGNTIDDLTVKSLHYAVGLPVSSTDMFNLRSAQLKGTYVLLGNTAPTWSGGGVAGSLTGASLTAAFNLGGGSVTGSVSVNVGGIAYSGTSMGFISSTSGTFSAFGGSSPGALNFSGFFAGTNAMRAGMAYDLYIPGGNVQGAAAFAQSGLTNPSGAAVALP